MPKQDDIEIISPARPEKTVSIYSDGSMVIADAALVLGVTPQGIRTWLDQGAPLHHKGSAGRGNGMRVIVADLMKWREDQLSEGIQETKKGQFDEKAEKARERHHIANMRERDDRQQAGELVAIEAVAEIVELQYAEVRAGLQNLPSRLATNLSAISDAREIRDIIRREVHGVLTSLSAGEDIAAEAASRSSRNLPAVIGDDDAE